MNAVIQFWKLENISFIMIVKNIDILKGKLVLFKKILSKLWSSKSHDRSKDTPKNNLVEKFEEKEEMHSDQPSTIELSINDQTLNNHIELVKSGDIEPIAEVVDNKSIVDRIVAEGRLEIIYGESNSMTIRALGQITKSEIKAIEHYVNVDHPVIVEGKSKKSKKTSTRSSGHGLAVDEPYRKLNYCTEFIDYSKKNNSHSVVSMFLKPNPMFNQL